MAIPRFRTTFLEAKQTGPHRRSHVHKFHCEHPPNIAEEIWVPGSELSTLCEQAVVAITRLDATAGMLLAPLTGLLLRHEAQSSSKIEFVEAPQVDIARATLGIRASDNAEINDCSHNRN